MEKAYFGAGCFWGIEQKFNKLPGVVSTKVGYMGGSTPSPNYKSVCTGQTGHAETVEIEYEPSDLDFTVLLSYFFDWHDATQINRQGPDIGTQYRSAIFPQTDEQKLASIQKIHEANQSGRYPKAIATAIEYECQFWEAEEYHQHYLDKRGFSHSGDL